GANIALASEESIVTVSATVVTVFQFASTALTITLNGVPVTCVMGEPVFPVAVPGAAASPATRIWSLVTPPSLAVMAVLVFAVLVASVTLLAVTVQLPAVLKVTEKVLVPDNRVLLAGFVSFGSAVVMLMVLVGAELTRFQLASTALTVTVKLVPAVCG